MLHEPAAESSVDNAAEFKAKLGVKMFIVYALIYAGFVVINVIDPTIMEMKVFSGLPLSVVYGFGLIFLALLMAIVYNHICSAKEKEVNPLEENKEESK